MLALEGRIVLSQVVPRPVSLTTVETPPTAALVPSAPAPAPASGPFAGNISQTLKAGTPVYEQRTTTWNNAPDTSQIEDELIVPGTGPNSGDMTTYEWISLKNNGGIEKVVDVRTVTDGSPTNPNATITTDNVTTTLPGGTVKKEVETGVDANGSDTHTNTTTLPDGTVQTNQYTDVFLPHHKTLIVNGSQPAPDGGTETYSGSTTKIHNRTTTSHTYNLPNGQVEDTHSVVITQGDSGQFETSTVHILGNRPTTTTSTTIINRLVPPAS
jgi:hypothetical protein